VRPCTIDHEGARNGYRCQALDPGSITSIGPAFRGRRWSLARLGGLYHPPNGLSMFGSRKALIF